MPTPHLLPRALVLGLLCVGAAPAWAETISMDFGGPPDISAPPDIQQEEVIDPPEVIGTELPEAKDIQKADIPGKLEVNEDGGSDKPDAAVVDAWETATPDVPQTDSALAHDAAGDAPTGIQTDATDGDAQVSRQVMDAACVAGRTGMPASAIPAALALAALVMERRRRV